MVPAASSAAHPWISNVNSPEANLNDLAKAQESKGARRRQKTVNCCRDRSGSRVQLSSRLQSSRNIESTTSISVLLGLRTSSPSLPSEATFGIPLEADSIEAPNPLAGKLICVSELSLLMYPTTELKIL